MKDTKLTAIFDDEGMQDSAHTFMAGYSKTYSKEFLRISTHAAQS